MHNIYVNQQEAVDINVHENSGNRANKGDINLKTEEASIQKVSIDFDIVKDSMKLQADSSVPNKYRLFFKYNAKVPCYLSIFLVAKVQINRETNMITGIYPKCPGDVKTMEVQVGENQSIPQNFCEFDLKTYAIEEIFDTINQQVPFIIVFRRKQQPAGANQLNSSTLFYKINRRDNMKGKQLSKGKPSYQNIF